MATALILIGFLIGDTIARGLAAIIAGCIQDVLYRDRVEELENKTKIGF